MSFGAVEEEEEEVGILILDHPPQQPPQAAAASPLAMEAAEASAAAYSSSSMSGRFLDPLLEADLPWTYTSGGDGGGNGVDAPVNSTSSGLLAASDGGDVWSGWKGGKVTFEKRNQPCMMKVGRNFSIKQMRLIVRLLKALWSSNQHETQSFFFFYSVTFLYHMGGGGQKRKNEERRGRVMN